MLRSLFTGVSGLRNHQTELDVVSNNLANINTLGFKAGRVTFKEAFAQTVRGAGRPSSTLGGTNPQQIGLGMSVASIDNLFTQGQFESTGVATDLAIEGDGFFVLSDGSGQFYTRAGTFRFDADGRLVSSDGRAVQGRPANEDGEIDQGAGIGDIEVPVGLTAAARATENVALTGNLDASQSPIASRHEGGTILAEAAATDALGELRNASGVALGLAAGQTVSFVANATSVTSIGDLHTQSGDAVSLSGATTVTVTDGTSSTQITTLTDSSTLEELRAAIEGALSSITVSIASDGALLLSNNGAEAVSVSMSAEGASEFNELLRGVAIAAGGTNFSARMDARADLRVGNGAGEVSTLGDLAAGLASALQEVSGSAATVDLAGGRLSFTGGGTEVTGITIRQSGGGSLLGGALGLPAVSFGANDTVSSSVLLDTASAEDSLESLHAADGTSLGITAGTELSFAATRGAETLAPVSIVVGADGTDGDNGAATYGGLLGELGSALDFASSGSVSIGESGGLVLQGDPGTANALSGLSLSASGSGAVAAAMQLSQTQSAKDVESIGSITVFDDLGNSHVVSLTFTKDPTATNVWSWQADVGGSAQISAGASGTATFNPDGSLASFATGDGQPLTFDPGSGATNPVSVTIDAVGDGPLAGLTQYAAPSEILLAGQDGHGSGVLESVVVDDRGVVNALFTNGTSRPVAQIVLAKFTNPAGLLRSRANAFVASTNSGTPLIVDPGNSAGILASGAIEMSNVDLAREFTSLIIAQRGFQANARTITTSDEMLTELVNLKR